MRIEVVSARDLIDADAIGKSDPYATIKFDGEDEALPTKSETPVIDNTLAPEWNHVSYFLVSDDTKSFEVKVKDQDVGRDSSLGHCTVLRADRDDRTSRNGGWLALEKGKNGQIQIFVTEIDLRNGLKGVRESKSEALLSAAEDQFQILEINIKEGDNCKGGGFGKPDPYCKIKFEDLEDGQKVYPEEELKTATINKTTEPVWNTVFHYLITPNVRSFKLHVMDEDIGSDDSLGHCHVVIGELNEEIDSKLALEKGKGTVNVSHCKTRIRGLFG
jgi:Ca2+-dependent lipid-binding protein